jgi:hypothetical protein
VPAYGASLVEVDVEKILEMPVIKDCGGLFIHNLAPTIKYNKSSPVPVVAVFTKYDVLVESLKLLDEEDLSGDIEQKIEDLEKEVGPKIDLNAGTSPSKTDLDVLSDAEEKLCKMITPFEVKWGVPWVKVSGMDILPSVPNARLS